MEFKIILYGTDEYQQMVDLRHRILRAPINLVATKEELEEDKNHLLIGVFTPDNKIVGCCFLVHTNESFVRLRQMAVDIPYQSKGIGAELLDYAESIAMEFNYQWIYLHARKGAVDFYKKLGYETEGDYFEEVGILHIEMRKNIEL